MLELAIAFALGLIILAVIIKILSIPFKLLTLEAVVAFAVGLLFLFIFIKIVSIPLRFLKWFITNSVVGAILLYIVTLLGVPLKINIISALVAGVLGLPGVLLIIAYTYL